MVIYTRGGRSIRDGIQLVKEEIAEAVPFTTGALKGKGIANGGGADTPVQPELQIRQNECFSCAQRPQGMFWQVTEALARSATWGIITLDASPGFIVPGYEMTVTPCSIVHADMNEAAMPCTGSDTINIQNMRSRTSGRMLDNLAHAKSMLRTILVRQQSSRGRIILSSG